MGGELRSADISRQRESILRFYAAMTGRAFDDITDEYLGRTEGVTMSNRLYQAVETAISYMNETRDDSIYYEVIRKGA